MKNKKISLGLLLMIVALVVVPGVIANSQYVESILGKNLVLNPGFEIGTTSPVNWTLVSQNNNSPIVDNVTHRGSKSIKIYIPGKTYLFSGYPQSDIIKVKPNRTYIASAWGKTENASGNNTPAVRIVELDANKSWINQTNLPVFSSGTNNWSQTALKFQTGANTSYVYFYGNIWDGNGTFWMDDFKLRLLKLK